MSKSMMLSQAAKLAENLGIDGEVSELVDTLKATAFRIKDGVASDSQLAALMIVAQQYNLNPWTKQIYAYPDKQNGIVPVVGVDGWISIIDRHPQYDGIEFAYCDEIVKPEGGKPCPAYIECAIYRKDRERPTRIREYLDEVYKKPNFPSPWQTHTKRFLRHKALIQCARVAFGFGGIYDPDEADNIIDSGEKIINPIPGTADRIGVTLDGMLAKISSMNSEELTSQALTSLDLKNYNKEDIKVIKVAITERRKSLKEQDDQNSIEAHKEEATEESKCLLDLMIKSTTTDKELAELYDSMTDEEKHRYNDHVDLQYSHLLGL